MKRNSLRILLVDDDQGDLRHLSRSVLKSGLKAECALTTGIEAACKLCAAEEFDCSVVDYQLPGKDGLAGITLLAEKSPHLPVIMATGHGDEAVATEAMKRGAADYIRKSDINPVSIRRVIENAIEKSSLRRKVAEQQQELARFADILVHDLRAPTSSIQTFIWDIQDALRNGQMESVEQYLAWTGNAAARMDTLISTLYQYTLADGAVEFSTVALDTVLNSTLVNLHAHIQKSGAIVKSDALPPVVGSESQLGQLLQNLIGNALKYCRAPIPRIHIAAQPSGDAAWSLSVCDNGIGIPENDLKRIFEPFTRLHGADTYEGTGLGLATCRRIVARHGGEIWAESKESVGTTIFFTLLAAPSIAVAPSDLSPQVETVTSASHPRAA